MSAATLALRRAAPLDAGAVGAILHDFARTTPWIPCLMSGAETVAHCGRMIDRGWVTVAEEGGAVQGFLAREGHFIHALYVAEGATGRGVGRALLDRAKAESPALSLRTFAANGAALRFYRRAGFRIMSEGDGRDNDEGLPDLRLDWHREGYAP
ncbi:GNAT family N-acetyltransferase [Rhodosalinus sp.]|uniref:GNAT family N-acetyltransferase n=1 Tax=Rhodosalinus sp. TaxID=2047741 RepID=UPI00356167D8